MSQLLISMYYSYQPIRSLNAHPASPDANDNNNKKRLYTQQ